MRVGDLSRAQDVITYGITLLETKDLIKKAKLKGGWEGFITENLPPLKKRVIQNWMFFAKNPHLHPFAWMGEERLLKAARCAKKYGGNDPIGAFLKAAGIPLGLEAGRVSMETKKKIDDAIEAARPQKPRVSKVNKLADQLIERLSKGLEQDGALAEVNLEKLETLEEKINAAKKRISEK